MFDHITINVRDFAASKALYTKALSSLGIREVFGGEGEYSGFGIDRPFFWLSATDKDHPVFGPVHIAFAGKSKKEVEDFHALALAGGAKDNAGPGYHVEYGSNYYAAFVLDLDGNNVEVVFREPGK